MNLLSKKSYIVKYNEIENSTIEHIINKINSNDYKLEKNYCLCGNIDDTLDIVLTDSFHPFNNIPKEWDMQIKFCSVCSLIRTDKYLDELSLMDYYNITLQKTN
jgi:hypothetical protein